MDAVFLNGRVTAIDYRVAWEQPRGVTAAERVERHVVSFSKMAKEQGSMMGDAPLEGMGWTDEAYPHVRPVCFESKSRGSELSIV